MSIAMPEKFSYKYLANGEIKNLEFDLYYLHSGKGKDCTFGKKSHYEVVNFRNSWRKKTGLHIEGRYNPGNEGVFESKSLDWMRCDAYLTGVEIGECIESHIDLGDLNILLLPPSRSLGKKAVYKNEHLGSIVGLGAHNHLSLLGYNLQIISSLSCSEFLEELLFSATSIIFVDETIMEGKTLGPIVEQLAKVCVQMNIQPPKFSVCTDFRKSREPIENKFPRRRDHGWKQRVTRDQHPDEPDWIRINKSIIDLLENVEE
jgi:hypothetical protein